MWFSVIILLIFSGDFTVSSKINPLPKDQIYGNCKYNECQKKISFMPVLNRNISTHYDYMADSIFFIEPSCIGDLNLRQACSVESAAKAHPSKKIVILFVTTVPDSVLKKDPLRTLLTYENVHMFRINVDAYVKDSPIESFLAKFILENSHYPVEHLSEILRFLTLHYYGGIFLDFDVIALKPFYLLPVTKDWIAVENVNRIASGVMAISKSFIGKEYIKNILSLMTKHYDPDTWYDNNSDIMKGALLEVCGTALLKLKPKNSSSHTTCHGLTVYGQDVFYAINSENAEEIFKPHFDISKISQSFAVNTYNSVTFDKAIHKDSAYGILMQKYCPKVYSLAKTEKFKTTKTKIFRSNESMKHNAQCRVQDLTSNIIF